mgnify:CR=1 FL=1
MSPDHPGFQAEFPVYQAFKWVESLEMLKPPKSENIT